MSERASEIKGAREREKESQRESGPETEGKTDLSRAGRADWNPARSMYSSLSAVNPVARGASKTEGLGGKRER